MKKDPMAKDKKKDQDPPAEELRRLALELIQQTTTMTLATTDGQGAWAAPVYYVYYQAVFYFFSSPDSRHIQEAGLHQAVSAALYPPADSWSDIRGIQMSGKIRLTPYGLHSMKIIQAYLKKYPFTTEFFRPGDVLDLGAFAHRFKVRLYGFEPRLVYYLDNKIRFGFRQEVDLVGNQEAGIS
ncbi:MAG: pyridoxamine 5'-phosphate oxidase family protein [Thermodesulfobacteriota bacterium]